MHLQSGSNWLANYTRLREIFNVFDVQNEPHPQEQEANG